MSRQKRFAGGVAEEGKTATTHLMLAGAELERRQLAVVPHSTQGRRGVCRPCTDTVLLGDHDKRYALEMWESKTGGGSRPSRRRHHAALAECLVARYFCILCVNIVIERFYQQHDPSWSPPVSPGTSL